MNGTSSTGNALANTNALVANLARVVAACGDGHPPATATATATNSTIRTSASAESVDVSAREVRGNAAEVL